MSRPPESPESTTGPVELSEGARRKLALAPREEALLRTLDDLSVRLDSLVAVRDGSRVRALTAMTLGYGIGTTLCVLGAGPIFGRRIELEKRLEPIDDPGAARVGERLRPEDEISRALDGPGSASVVHPE